MAPGGSFCCGSMAKDIHNAVVHRSCCVLFPDRHVAARKSTTVERILEEVGLHVRYQLGLEVLIFATDA